MVLEYIASSILYNVGQVLKILSNRASVTIRVRHNGHSLELDIIRSEHS